MWRCSDVDARNSVCPMKKNTAFRLVAIFAASVVLGSYYVLPYLCGRYMVSAATSAPFWYKGARINKWAAFHGARKALENEHVLRGLSLYYFYLLAKNRDEQEKDEAARIIREGASNTRDLILSSVLECGDLKSDMSGVDIEFEMSRDEPVRKIVSDYDSRFKRP